MPWRNVATQDVLNDFTPMEAALIKNIQGGSGNLAAVLTQVIDEVRGMIKAGGNQVDQSGPTVPDQLFDDVTCLARWKWIISLPQLKTMQTYARRQAAMDAQKRLANIASQSPTRERVELPAMADTTPAAVPLPSTGQTKYDHRKWRGEDGIV